MGETSDKTKTKAKTKSVRFLDNYYVFNSGDKFY